MAKKSTKKAVKKTTKKAVKKAKVKDERDDKVSEFKHRLDSQSGFIDISLKAGTPIGKIKEEWDKAHPGNPMKSGRFKGHLQHLVEKHGFSKTTAQQLLAESKTSKKNK